MPHIHLQVTPATIKAVAAAPNLKKLDLILPTKCKQTSLAPLENHAKLEKLTLVFEGFHAIRLPLSLPNLKHLSLTACKWTYFNWAQLVTRTTSYLRLKTLTIVDEYDSGGVNRSDISSLSCNCLIGALHSGLLRGGKSGHEDGTDNENGVLIIERIGRRSPLWAERRSLGHLIQMCKTDFCVTIDVRDEEAMNSVHVGTDNLDDPLEW